MITKYRTSRFSGGKIEAVQVERETETGVWINGRRSAKTSKYCRYFNTWDEAHGFLLYNAMQAVAGAERRLQDAQDHFRRIDDMERPERQEIET